MHMAAVRTPLRLLVRPDFLYGPTFLLAAVLFSIAASQGGWRIVLAWPAMSCLLISAAYWTGQVSLFGKRFDGSRNFFCLLLLLPYLATAYAVWRLNVLLTREPPINIVNDSLV